MKQFDLYRTLWRWHFYAGLFCLPLVFILALSGAVYLFKPQLQAAIDAPLQSQLNQNVRLSTAQQQIDKALQAVPGAWFYSYRLAEQAVDPAKITLYVDGDKTYVYIDRYDLSVLKIIKRDDQFIRWVKKFHGELLLGDKGSLLVELAACWAIVLVLTGVYLWWPRKSSGLAGVLYPRISASGRLFWRDLHAVVGFWLAFFILFLLISGLPWTQVWGGTFKQLKALDQTPMVAQGWSTNEREEKIAWRALRVRQTNLSPALLAKASTLEFAAPAELSLSDIDKNIWRLSSNSQNRPLRQKAWIDGASLTVLQRETFVDKKLIDQIVGVGIAAHEGHLFGWPNQLLGVLVTLGLVLLTVSGFWLWWQRKPVDKLGAQRPTANTKAQRVVLLLMLALALLLPLLLASIIAIVLFELLILPRLSRLSVWLGARAG